MSGKTAMAFNIADLAIVSNAAFKGAFVQLTMMLSPHNASAVLDGFTEYLMKLGLDTANSPSETLQAAVGAPMVITLLHLEMGTPLYIDDRLFALWACNGTEPAECATCGYRMPAVVKKCVICGGMTGEGGVWSKRRAAMAGQN
jgi:hypothetical protein